MSKHDEAWEMMQQIASGAGVFIMRTPDGKEIKAQLLPMADGSIGLFSADDIVEGEVIKPKRLGRGK